MILVENGRGSVC